VNSRSIIHYTKHLVKSIKIDKDSIMSVLLVAPAAADIENQFEVEQSY